MRGYQQEKRKGPLAIILRGGTHPVSCLEISMGVTESDATEQLNTFTFTKEKSLSQQRKKRRRGENG